MHKIIFILIALVSLNSCKGKKGPDVSGIKADISIDRFDRDFFAIDSNNIAAHLPVLQKKYPSLFPIFIENVLGLGRLTEDNPEVEKGIRQFLNVNKQIYDSVALKFRNTGRLNKELQQAFKYVKFYFPGYSVPGVATLVGPIDAMAQMNGGYTPNFIGPDFIAISLQFYLGRNFSLYQHEFFIVNIAPLYRSRRFEKEYIVSDVMKLIADDIFPDKSRGRPLIEQMIEKGKQWYLLDHFMPEAADSIKTGFTQKQVEWCKENEGLIWNYIITNENLYSIEPVVLQTYIGESPFTLGMPEASPGNIGPWIGMQIIKKFAARNPELKLQEILQTEPAKILEAAKYKPK